MAVFGVGGRPSRLSHSVRLPHPATIERWVVPEVGLTILITVNHGRQRPPIAAVHVVGPESGQSRQAACTTDPSCGVQGWDTDDGWRAIIVLHNILARSRSPINFVQLLACPGDVVYDARRG